MKMIKHISRAVLIIIMGLVMSVSAKAQDAKVIEMKGTDNLKFTVTDITAKPGQKITVKLTTVSDFPKAAMAHNFVLLTAEADALAVANAAAGDADHAYIPPEKEDQILAYTGLAGDGETVTVTFKAPEEPGKYEYICTFPGHYAAGMKGTLTVKKIN